MLHNELSGKEDIKPAIIYSMRNWLAFRMVPAGDTHVYLERAYQGAMAAHRRNEPDVRLFVMAIFMAIESGHVDIAQDMLDKAKDYKAFLRINEPFYFGYLIFLRGYLATRRQHSRGIKKYRRAFSAHLLTTKHVPLYDVMWGQLYLATGEYANAYECLAKAYTVGCRSVYLYEGLYRCLRNAPGVFSAGTKLLQVLIFAVRNGGYASPIIVSNEGPLFAEIMENPLGGEQLYELTNSSALLRAVCTNRIRNNDVSLTAYRLYREAVEKQVPARGLAVSLLQGAYANGIEYVNRYIMEQFLGITGMDMDMSVYVCHLLLTNPALDGLVNSNEGMITRTAALCMEKGIEGRRTNTLYQYHWEQSRKKSRLHGRAANVLSVCDQPPSLEGDCEAALQKGLIQFELHPPPEARYIYISHPQKRGMEEYELPADSPYLVIEAANENFSYKCLGQGRRTVIDEPITIKRMVPLANLDLYQHFFDKGDRRFYLLAYLAAHYLAHANPKAIPIFEALLEEKSLTKPYRINMLIALGNLQIKTGSINKALEIYSEIDINDLNPEDTNSLLQAYLQVKEYSKAASLVDQRHTSLPNPALYEALCVLHDGQVGKLAHIAYNLLLSGYNSEALLDAVLTHHKASQTEWKALLAILPSPDPRLDRLILAGDIWSGQLDITTEKAFRRLLGASQAPKECNDFIDFCIYQMLTQNLLPEYDTVNALEKIYGADSQNTYLLLALCHTYLSHNLTTFRSDKLIGEAITLQEEADILLPVFKRIKVSQHPYVEKYQPFLYQAAPEKDIRLNYQLDSSAGFSQIPMKYLRYGLYTAKIPLFFNETVTYYYSEEMPTGSITTHQYTHKNTTPYLLETNHPDPYFAINNAVIYEQMFRQEKVEKMLEGLVKDKVVVRAQLL